MIATPKLRKYDIDQVIVMQGDDIIAEGSINECAAKLGVRPNTIYFYTTPSYQKRLEGRDNLDKSRVVVRLDDDDE